MTIEGNDRIMEIRPGTSEDLETVLAWLKAEEDSGKRSFYCNRSSIEGAFKDGEFDVFVIDDFPVSFLAYGLAKHGIMETHPDYRRRGHGTDLAKRALKAAINSDNRCLIEIQCSPETSAEFWKKKMGFTIYEEQTQTLAYLAIGREHVLPAGEPIDITIEQHWEQDQYGDGSTPLWSLKPEAVRCRDGFIYLSKRMIFAPEQFYGKPNRRAPVARVLVHDREIFFDVAGFISAKEIGMKQDRYGTPYFDTIIDTSEARPSE